MGRTKKPRQSMQVFLDQKNQTVPVPVSITNALLHMQDTGQLHYSTAILPENAAFAPPRAHVQEHVHLLHRVKQGSSVLAQKAIKAKFGDDAFTPQGALTVVTPDVPLFAPPAKVAKLVHTGSERSIIGQIREDMARRQPPVVLPLPNVPPAFSAPPQAAAQPRPIQPAAPQPQMAAQRQMPPAGYRPSVYRPAQPSWKRVLEEVKSIPASEWRKIKDKVTLAINIAEREDEAEGEYIRAILAMEGSIGPKVLRGENAEATKAAVAAILEDF